MFLEQWSNEGVLELRTAFSRDQTHKIYVQDLIVEDAKHLWKLLEVIHTIAGGRQWELGGGTRHL